MKKSTFLIGVISSFLILIGVLMKIQHWPLAGVAITLGAVSFALGYSVMLYIDKSAVAQNSYQRFVNVMTLFTMIIIMVAFLFKVQHWPGAGIGIIVGHLLLLLMIPVLFIHGSKESDPVKKMDINNIAIILVVLTAFSFLMWLRLSRGN
jgi:hypothetical protein